MKRTVLALVALALVGGCRSTRNTPCETLDTATDGTAKQLNSQENQNLDFDSIVLVGDSGTAQTAAPTKSTVEVQVNNNAHAPQITDIFGVNAKARAILEHVGPGEAATARTLVRIEARLQAVEDDLDLATNSPPRIAHLQSIRSTLMQEQGVAIAKLEAYADQKLDRFEAADGGMLDLSKLEDFTILILGGSHVGTDKVMSDGEAQAIMGAVQSALLRRVPVASPAPAEGGGS